MSGILVNTSVLHLSPDERKSAMSMLLLLGLSKYTAGANSQIVNMRSLQRMHGTSTSHKVAPFDVCCVLCAVCCVLGWGKPPLSRPLLRPPGTPSPILTLQSTPLPLSLPLSLCAPSQHRR